MKRTEPLRREPQQLVPWAVSVISVGLNYYKSPARSPMSVKPTAGFRATRGATITMT